MKPLVYESRIKVPYSWSAGEVGTHFLTQLKAGRIVGTRCPACGKVSVPPRKSCGACFVPFERFVDVGPGGVLETFTRSCYESAAQPAPRPAFGLIRLDGADNSFLHHLDPASFDRWKPGARVEAVFREERRGHILDILHFKEAR
jgi:uncharacterized OB-fold protein